MGERLALVVVLSSAALAQTKPTVHVVGAARQLDDRVRLTPAREQTAGAFWLEPALDVAYGFDASFTFQITQPGGLGGGADGFAFVLQNQGVAAIAGRGSAGGFAFGDGSNDRTKPGIPRSIAVFFDTYHNTDGMDPSNNYVAICANGPMAREWPPARLAVARTIRPFLKDGRVHAARVRYVPPIMEVHLDDDLIARAPVDLKTVIDSSGRAFVGFTASTGGGFANHDILNWSFDTPHITSAMVQSDIHYLPPNCLPDRNLCTPAEPVVEETAPSRYRIVLPANFQSGLALANPDARAVDLANVAGTVCWPDKSADFQCAGPEALVMKTAGGRTTFSLNVPEFKHNQGFLEFNVSLR